MFHKLFTTAALGALLIASGALAAEGPGEHKGSTTVQAPGAGSQPATAPSSAPAASTDTSGSNKHTDKK